MLIIGDVLMIVAAIVFSCASVWATIVACCLLFSHKVKHAETTFETKPWAAFGVGFLTLLVVLTGVAILWANPVGRFLGTTFLMLVLSVGMMGAGGLAKVLSKRISPLDPSVSVFKNISRGAGLLVALALVPLIGWFLFVPIMIVMSLGAGFLALFSRMQPQPLNEGPQFDVRS